MPHISIKADTIFEIFGFHITNSLLLTYVLLVLFFFLSLYVKNNIHKNSYPMLAIRTVIKALYGLFESLMKDKINLFFPILGAFFVFIWLSNWTGLLPGVGSVLIRPQVSETKVQTETTAHSEEGAVEEPGRKVPLFRAGTADLNTTLALALVAVFFIQFYGFKHLGPKYATKFINLKNPIGFGLGLLEIVSEFSRILSFSFRLFGNIFAGEVLLAIVAFLVPVLASFPFLMLELFVGIIQALVFAMLTAVFFSTAIAHEDH